MNFDVSRLKDPLFFAENRVAAHSDHVAYASMEELSHGETSLRCSLNGLWKFHHALNAGQVIPGFEAADYDSRGWADIHVPAHIQMEGYGAPQYANVQYPWDGYQAVEIGEIPQEYNPVASYIKTFFVPTQMVGKRVFISFQGAESCIAVWLNGRYVGFSSDSFTPSEFEQTDYLVEGENKLACRVERWSAGSWLEDQDFMRFSGIFRDVYLYAIPKAHIADIRVKTLLDDSFTDATLDLAMKMELDAAVGACRVKMALLDGGEVIAAAERVAEGEIAVQLPVKAPRLWSSEAPNLYDLLLTVEDGSGEVLEVVRQRVGFRRFELKNAVIPVLTVVGMQIGSIMAGSVVVESIFSVPGMGSMISQAITDQDYNLVQGSVLFIALFICAINLVVDIVYAFIDPRIKAQYKGGGKKKNRHQEKEKGKVS